MAYITPGYYNDVYRGTPAPTPEDLEKYIERASDTIDQLTSYRLYGVDLDKLPTLVQELVRKATAAQVEFFVVNGGDAELNAGTGDEGGVTVGAYSYTSGPGSSSANSRDIDRVSPTVLGYLEPTGLLYRGLSVYGC